MLKKAIIFLVVMLLLGLIASCGLASPPQTVVVIQTVIVTASNTFSYPVRVQSKETGENISNARITIEVTGKAPLDEITDNNGFARVFIDVGYVGQPSKLIVQATGYKQYVQSIDLNPEILPDIVQLESIADIVSPTAVVVDTPVPPTNTPIPPTNTLVPSTNTPVPTNTPIPTDTPLPTFTATSTNTPIPPTPVPISTVLAPRESWVQDGVVLTLAGGFYDVNNSCIGMIFEFKNESSDTIIVAGKARNFRAEDNLGQSWKLTMLGGTWIDFHKCSNTIDEKFLERSLGPGEEFDKYSDFSEKGFYVGFTGPLTNNSVEHLDVIVDGFSRITNARWRIPVKH